MTWPEAGPKLAAAVVAGTLTVLLVTGARGRSGRILGAFLGLIAANQAAEAFRALDPDPAGQLFWFKVASVAAAVDPAVLLWFWHSERRSRTSAAALALGGAASAALALWAGWALGVQPGRDPETHAFPFALAVHTLLAYGFVLAAAYARGGTPGVLGAAYAVAAIPVLPRAAGEGFLRFLGPLGGDRETYLALGVLLPLLLAAAACLALASRRAPRARLGAGLAMTLVLLQDLRDVDVALAMWGLLPDVEALGVLGRISAAVRWLLFGALASVAVFSASGAGMSLAARRRAARVLLGVSFVVGAAVVLLALQPLFPGAPLGAGEMLVLLVAVALSQAFGRLVDRTANRVYGVPAAGNVAAAHDAYRRAAARALGEGRSPSRDSALQRLREDLGIDVGTATMLERAAEQLLAGPLAPGQLLMGRYLVESLLGRGGSGRAFLARDLFLDRNVVVKEVARSGGDDEGAVEEARVAGSLDHPQILTVHDVLRRGDHDYLVTEHLPGGTLAERIESPLPEAEARRLLGEVLSGLAAMHERGILHRDVKPQNVLLTRDGRAKLADFGLARRRTDETVGESLAPHFAGTPAYLAPEVRAGAAPTAAADVYAVGVLCERLFPGGPPPDLRRAVEKARAADPSERWRDAGEMLRAAQDARQ